MDDATSDLLFKAFCAVLSTVILPWAVSAYERRTRVAVTDQQRAAVQAALTTGAGSIKTMLDQGLIVLRTLTANHPAVVQAAAEALARVPDSAAAQGITPEAAREIIMGRVDTSAVPGPLAAALPASHGYPL